MPLVFAVLVFIVVVCVANDSIKQHKQRYGACEVIRIDDYGFYAEDVRHGNSHYIKYSDKSFTMLNKKK